MKNALIAIAVSALGLGLVQEARSDEIDQPEVHATLSLMIERLLVTCKSAADYNNA